VGGGRSRGNGRLSKRVSKHFGSQEGQRAAPAALRARSPSPCREMQRRSGRQLISQGCSCGRKGLGDGGARDPCGITWRFDLQPGVMALSPALPWVPAGISVGGGCRHAEFLREPWCLL